ncbi:MAG: PilZ domain-containing protein [Pseudomonadota bacterium]
MHGSVTQLAIDRNSKVGRRSAPRLRLALPGKLVTIYETRACIVANLSETGAMIGVFEPLALGDSAFLQCGGLDQFSTVVRSGKGLNALHFEVPLTHDQVLAVRAVSEDYDEIERQAFRQTAREWIMGGA